MLENTATKDLDTTFIHYGIRKDDMVLVEMLARKHGIDADWLRDFLRALHKERAVQDDFDDKAIERVMEQALKRLANDVETGLYAPVIEPIVNKKTGRSSTNLHESAQIKNPLNT
jgi:hypothetical protein